MPILPSKNLEALMWLQARADDWLENAPAIGLTVGQANAVLTATTQAQTAVNNAESARAASKAATTAQNGAFGTMRDEAQTAINIIKAFANNSPDPATVYSVAQIPPPSVPLPNPPENPYDLRFLLQQTGELEIKWSGSSNGGSAVYIISRSIQTDPASPPSPMSVVGYSGERSYVDASIPACTVAATYSVRAVKGQYSTPGSTPATARFTPAETSDPGLRMVA